MSQIHQEVTFAAGASSVYRALLDPAEFAKFTEAPAEISDEEGGAFKVFGEYILGRNVELVPNRRIVQAWRAFNWEEGVYSIVRFELIAEGENTRLVFDQDGVPEEAVPHVTPGWSNKYWEPLRGHLE